MKKQKIFPTKTPQKNYQFSVFCFCRFSDMPRVVSIPGGFYVATEADPTKHFERIALDLGELGCDQSFADVNIHCRNKIFKVIDVI